MIAQLTSSVFEGCKRVLNSCCRIFNDRISVMTGAEEYWTTEQPILLREEAEVSVPLLSLMQCLSAV